MNRPLSHYVVVVSVLSVVEIVACIEAIMERSALAACVFPEGVGVQIGLFKWLKGQIAFASINILFAFYAQSQLWAQLAKQKSHELSGPPTQPVKVSGPDIRSAFAHVMCEDFGILAYFFMLFVSFYWSYSGSNWILLTPATCNIAGWPNWAAWCGITFFWVLGFFALQWWCFVECFSSCGSEYHMPASDLVGFSYRSPEEAAQYRDTPGPAADQGWGNSAQALRGAAGFSPPVTAAGAAAGAGAAVGAAGAAAGVVRGSSGCARACTVKQLTKLVACIIVDLLGDASYLLPGVGEVEDVAYAPMQAILLKMLFEGNGIAMIGFIEELLPFTDGMPTATIAWFLETFAPDSSIVKLIGLSPADPIGSPQGPQPGQPPR